MKAPHGKKGPKPLQKGSGTLFGGVFAGFLALDASKKVFEHFLIDILCCLNILNNISKIEKNHTVPLTTFLAYAGVVDFNNFDFKLLI